MNTERRSSDRFLVDDMTFATLSDGFKKAGKAKDISVGGLSFTYFRENGEMNLDIHHTQVDIFLPGKGIRLNKIPCNIVYDIFYLPDGKGLLVRMKRCGLSFGKLTKNQLDQLNLFIKTHTKQS